MDWLLQQGRNGAGAAGRRLRRLSQLWPSERDWADAGLSGKVRDTDTNLWQVAITRSGGTLDARTCGLGFAQIPS